MANAAKIALPLAIEPLRAKVQSTADLVAQLKREFAEAKTRVMA